MKYRKQNDNQMISTNKRTCMTVYYVRAQTADTNESSKQGGKKKSNEIDA